MKILQSTAHIERSQSLKYIQYNGTFLMVPHDTKFIFANSSGSVFCTTTRPVLTNGEWVTEGATIFAGYGQRQAVEASLHELKD